MPNGLPSRVFYIGSPELFSKGAGAIQIMKMCQVMGRLRIDVRLIIPVYESPREMHQYYGVESNFTIIRFPYFRNYSLRNIVHGVLSAIYK
jgi:hypothetical protein